MVMPENFTRKEFKCECCDFDSMDYSLILMLEDCREYFNKKYGKAKIVITSGNRCRGHNEEVQKKHVKNYIPFTSRSQHMSGKAADFKVFYFDEEWILVKAKEVYEYLDNKHESNCGLGLYHNRVHLDSRSQKARWIK